MSDKCTVFITMSSCYVSKHLTECEDLAKWLYKILGCWALSKRFSKMTFWTNCKKCKCVSDAVLSPLVGSKGKAPEAPCILRYLWSKKLIFLLLLAVEYSKISKLWLWKIMKDRRSVEQFCYFENGSIHPNKNSKIFCVCMSWFLATLTKSVR